MQTRSFFAIFATSVWKVFLLAAFKVTIAKGRGLAVEMQTRSFFVIFATSV
jgi:hypothetical protein